MLNRKKSLLIDKIVVSNSIDEMDITRTNAYLTSGLRELSGLAMVVPPDKLDMPYPAMDKGSWL